MFFFGRTRELCGSLYTGTAESRARQETFLEVVGDADHWVVDVVEAAGLLRFETEVRGLHE